MLSTMPKTAEVATFGRKRIIVYNDNGTVNLNLTASAGTKIVQTADRLQRLLQLTVPPPSVIAQVCVENIYCVPHDGVVFWEGLRITHGSARLLSMQFAYNGTHGTFPVKVTEVGEHVQYFSRNWQKATRYVVAFIEALHG